MSEYKLTQTGAQVQERINKVGSLEQQIEQLSSAVSGMKIPTALPNPNALTFAGAATGTYDGSEAMTVNIPSRTTDDHINSLIDAKLGVIENGTY